MSTWPTWPGGRATNHLPERSSLRFASFVRYAHVCFSLRDTRPLLRAHGSADGSGRDESPGERYEFGMADQVLVAGVFNVRFDSKRAINRE